MSDTQVPHYLQMRKLQLAEERDAKQRAKRTALCPPGPQSLSSSPLVNGSIRNADYG